MSKIVAILAFLSFLTASSFSQHSWQRLSGPTGGHVIGIYSHPNGTFYATILASDINAHPDCFLVRSQDQGETWTELSNTPSTFSNLVSVNSTNGWPDLYFTSDSKIVLTTPNESGQSIYVSADDGLSWKLLKDSVFRFLGTGKPDEYFVFTFTDSIYRTIDAGATWTNITPGGNIFEYASNASYISWVSGNAYLCIGRDVTLISTDNCQSFKVKDFHDMAYVTSITKLPSGEYLGRYDQQIEIVDVLKNSLSFSYTLPSELSSGGPRNLSIAGTNTILGLENSGYALTPYLGYAPKLFILDSKNKSMSPLRGMPPQEFNYPTGSYTSQTNTLIAGDELGNILFSTGDGLYKTTDSGLTWKELPIMYDNAYSIQVDGSGRIFVKGDEAFDYDCRQEDSKWLKMSANNGRLWRRIAPFGHSYAGIVGPGYEGGIITTSKDSSGCLTGMDIWFYGGAEYGAWTNLSRVVYPAPGATGGGPGSADVILVDSADNIYIGAGTLYKSEDKGKNWDYLMTEAPIDVERAAFTPSWKLYVGGRANKIASTSDGGNFWIVSGRLPASAQTIISSIVAPSENLVFVGTNQHGIFKSSDAGATWVQFPGPWGDTISCLGYTMGGTIYIGTITRGLFSSDLNGGNIINEPVRSPANHVQSIFVDKGKDVYVGMDNSPVWKLSGIANGVTVLPIRNSDYTASIGSDGALRLACNSPVSLSISVYDALGKELRNIPQYFSSGEYVVPLDLKGFSYGVYYIRIAGKDQTEIIRFIL